MSQANHTSPTDHPKDWVNIAFLTLTPILAVLGTAAWTVAHGFQWWMPVLLVVMYLLVGVSVTAGYHRFFSHKSYDAHPAVQAFFAFFGAMAAQNSILWWSASHRVHHKYVDQDWDPYNIRRGFWWAHIFWIFYRNPASGDFSNARDLERNPIVMWQHKWHKVIMVVGGFGIPALIGALMGDAVAGLLWGGFARIALIHHTTFFVNSLAHSWGRKIYSFELSARDNWAVALLTLGEGYHSFHHRFPADFRNGIFWYQWDPSKWFIRAAQAMGLARGLKSTPAPLIEQARMEAAVRQLGKHIEKSLTTHYGEEISRRLAVARESLERAIALWKRQREARLVSMRRFRLARRTARRHVRIARREWRAAVRLLQRIPQAA
ncbi:MAG TPA: fatty acid desaturase [Thermoanaerobaculia bacterium]|nr:fatty acid desaturase [Thermoanaerobaculia bacterium]